MPINYGEGGADWEKLPKVGESPKDFKIVKAERIDDPNYKYNFTKKEEVKDKDGVAIMANGKPVMSDVNQGFRYVYTLEDGKKFSISSWKPYYAFAEVNVNEGDHIRVSHPSEVVWKVEKLNKQESEVKPQTQDDLIAWDE